MLPQAGVSRFLHPWPGRNLCQARPVEGQQGRLRGSKDEAGRKTREEGERERALEAGALGMASHEATVNRKLLSLTLISTPAATGAAGARGGRARAGFRYHLQLGIKRLSGLVGRAPAQSRLWLGGRGVVARVHHNAQAPLA